MSKPPTSATSTQSEDISKAKEALKTKFQVLVPHFCLFHRLYGQLLNGCGRECCFNPYCSSCPCIGCLERLRDFIDCEKFGNKDEAAQKVLKLIENKEPVDICQKPEKVTRSLQIDSVLAATKEFTGKKALFSKTQESILATWQQVFSNQISLGLSFRKHTGKILPDFLQSSPDFDYDAIDCVIALCKKNEAVHQRLLKSIVFFCARKSYIISMNS